MAKSRVLYGLFSLLMLGMTIGAVVQVVLFSQLETSNGMSSWEDDPDARLLRVGMVKQEIISWAPRIILFRNFLSLEECDYLIAIARPRLEKSTVVDVKTGKAIERRISVYSMIPAENGELLQILRYEPGQYYKPHYDYFVDEFNVKLGGQRVATFLMYLNEGMEGGETHFPRVGGMTCHCGGEQKKGTCVTPLKGDAILVWSQKLDGSIDPATVHGSCAVVQGEKWSATKWLRQQAFS